MQKTGIRMFRIFVSASSLERICLDEMGKESKEQSPWFLLLSKQNVIYIDEDIYSKLDGDDPLSIFSYSYYIEYKKSDIDYNSIVKDNPKVVLQHPQGVLLLDIDKDTAELIQKDYGVVCQSTLDLSNCLLATSENKISLCTGDQQYSWKDLFNKRNDIPSNSLVFIDRYIFAYEGVTHCGYKEGITNIKCILANILPDKLLCDYHVLILFDDNLSNDRNYTIEKVWKELDEYKNKVLKRPYNIVFELFSVTSKCEGYADTHNRKIISNYFIVSAEHYLRAFAGDGVAVGTQDIRVEYTYSNGLLNSQSAVKSISHLLMQISKMKDNGILEQKEMKNFQKGGCKAYTYQSDFLVEKLQNRLIQSSNNI